MKYRPSARALGAFLLSLAVLAPARPASAGPTAPQAPIVHQAPPATVPQYGELTGEWDIALGHLADGTDYEPRIPYTDVMDQGQLAADLGKYGPRLAHSEDPRNGVTVSAVMTDPAGGGHTWPVVYYEDMAIAAGTSASLVYDTVPTGYTGWHLNFRPKILGAWTGHLTVTDAGGTVAGPTFTFTCAGVAAFPEAAAGDLITADLKYIAGPNLLGGDGRSIVYSNTGNVWQPLGEDAASSPAGGPSAPDLLSRMALMHASGARGLLRGWQCADFPLTNGGVQLDQPRPASMNNGANGISSLCAHGGRYGYKLTTGGGGPDNLDLITYHSPPGQAEKYGVWVRAFGVNAGATVGVTLFNAYSVPEGPSDQHATDASGISLTDGAWHYVAGAVPAADPGDYGFPLYGADGQKHVQSKHVQFTTVGLTSGYWAVDDWDFVEQSHDPAAGPGSAWDLSGGEGDYESQNGLNARGGAMLDAAVAGARANDAELMLEFFSARQGSQASVAADGGQSYPMANDGSPNNLGSQEGSYSAPPTSQADDGCETAVGLFHFQQVRQWVGHFGWAVGQGVALLAYANEIDNNGLDNSGVDHWAIQMREQASGSQGGVPDCKPLCGADVYEVGAGTSRWDAGLYESPWLQWAEPHQGTGPGGGNSDVPFNGDTEAFVPSWGTRSASGGPFGLGYVEFGPQGGYTPLLELPTVRVPASKAGRDWTLSYYAQTAPGYASPTANGGINVHESDGQRPFAGGNDYTSGLPTVPAFGLPAWSRRTGTFRLPAGVYRGVALQLYSPQAAGVVRFADVALTDPDGRAFFRAKFNEPLLDAGAGDAVATLVETFAYSFSGEAAVDRPVVIGEDETYWGSPVTTVGPGGSYSTNSVKYPMAQYALRDAAAMPDPRWHADTFWGEDSQVCDLVGGAKPFAVMQSLLDGFLRADGTWRAMTTAQTLPGVQPSDPVPDEPFVVYAQANNREVATGGIVDATKAAVSILPARADPATPHAFLPGTGPVDLQGLADGPYTVQEYDIGSGRLVTTLTTTSAAHHLSVSVAGLTTGLFVKVSPVSAPNLTVQLAVDHATARQGDIVTYTLTYTNTGTGPALGITVPWAVPSHMQFLSASGGTYDSAKNVVNWNLGTLAPGASGSVVLKARVQ